MHSGSYVVVLWRGRYVDESLVCVQCATVCNGFITSCRYTCCVFWKIWEMISAHREVHFSANRTSVTVPVLGFDDGVCVSKYISYIEHFVITNIQKYISSFWKLEVVYCCEFCSSVLVLSWCEYKLLQVRFLNENLTWRWTITSINESIQYSGYYEVRIIYIFSGKLRYGYYHEKTEPSYVLRLFF